MPRYLGDDPAAWAGHDACELVRRQTFPGTILIDQGEADPFLEAQLKPESVDQACAEAGQPLVLRRHAGYDQSCTGSSPASSTTICATMPRPWNRREPSCPVADRAYPHPFARILPTAAKLQRFRVDNRAHLAPWEPLREDSYYTLEHCAQAIADGQEAARLDRGYPFVVFDPAEVEHPRQLYPGQRRAWPVPGLPARLRYRGQPAGPGLDA
ncbi:hypothetical protein [Rhodanobacter lindaniclasticus]